MIRVLAFDISDDATINLENGKMIKIRDLKHDKLIQSWWEGISHMITLTIGKT